MNMYIAVCMCVWMYMFIPLHLNIFCTVYRKYVVYVYMYRYGAIIHPFYVLKFFINLLIQSFLVWWILTNFRALHIFSKPVWIHCLLFRTGKYIPLIFCLLHYSLYLFSFDLWKSASQYLIEHIMPVKSNE